MSQHIYTYDPANDQLNEIGGAGHIIKDESGTSFTKRENLQFNRMTVTDDATSNSTIVEPIETNFVGTWEEWEALTLAERAQYETVDLLDDFNGAPIDPTPTKDSINPVQSGGVYDALDPMLNVLGAKNLLPNNATSQTVGNVTFTVNSDGSVTANGTAASGSNPYIKLTENFTVPRSGQYIVSGNPIAGDVASDNWTTDIYLSDRTSGAHYDFDSTGDEQYYFDSTHVYRISLYVKAGESVSNAVFYPMIRPASIADDTYVPYAMTNKELTETIKDINIPYVAESGITIDRVSAICKNNRCVFKARVQGTFPAGTTTKILTIGEGYRQNTQYNNTLAINTTSTTICAVIVNNSGEVYLNPISNAISDGVYINIVWDI